MDAFRNMHLFVEVARTGGFRAAAERLGMQNSTLSRRIGQLERDIGLRLLNRTTRRVELTEAGRLYFERCSRIIEDARLAQEELASALAQPTGVIRASVPVDFTVVYLSRIVADFQKLYPGISLELDVTPRKSNLVTEPVDLTIRIGEPTEQNWIARKLATLKSALFAGPSCLSVSGMPGSPQELLKFNCLRVSDRPWTLVNRLTGEEQIVSVMGSVRANNIGLLRRAGRGRTGRRYADEGFSN